MRAASQRTRDTGPRYRAAVLLAAYGGLRAGELFGLRAKRVDVLRRQVAIAETVVDVGGHLHFGPPKTRGGHRTVPLPRVASESLGEHLATFARTPEDLILAAPEGGPVSLNVWRRRFWVPATKAAGLGHLRLHDLRHTAVALWIAAGAHPKEVAVRAGHTSLSFTSTATDTCFRGLRKCSTTLSMPLHNGAAPPIRRTIVRDRARRNPIPSRT